MYHLGHAHDLDTACPRMHKLDLKRNKLCFGDTALQVSLPSRLKKAASVERTHIHIGDSDPHVPGLVEVELVAAYDPSFAAVFASVGLRDEAQAYLRNCKFVFGDDEVESLAVDALKWNGSIDTVYQLGSGPLKSVANRQETASHHHRRPSLYAQFGEGFGSSDAWIRASQISNVRSGGKVPAGTIAWGGQTGEGSNVGKTKRGLTSAWKATELRRPQSLVSASPSRANSDEFGFQWYGYRCVLGIPRRPSRIC